MKRLRFRCYQANFVHCNVEKEHPRTKWNNYVPFATAIPAVMPLTTAAVLTRTALRAPPGIDLST
eukprot:scaffold8292_cov126-Skeletonema_marinoi.AAC.2